MNDRCFESKTIRLNHKFFTDVCMSLNYVTCVCNGSQEKTFTCGHFDEQKSALLPFCKTRKAQ